MHRVVPLRVPLFVRLARAVANLAFTTCDPQQEGRQMTLYEYFDRIAIIHLPDRPDRFQSLSTELRDMGIDIRQPKVQIPHAPVPSDWNGWPSRGVYGNFLSHLGILRQALQDGLQTIWVLEDDAIFSRRMRREQQALVETLKEREWDLCFFGHSLTHELAEQPTGFVAPNAGLHLGALLRGACARIAAPRRVPGAGGRPARAPSGGQ